MGAILKIKDSKIVKVVRRESSTEHSKYSPSGIESWTLCPAFGQIENPRKSSVANKGTKIHEEEYKKILRTLLKNEKPFDYESYSVFVDNKARDIKNGLVCLEAPYVINIGKFEIQGSPDAVLIDDDKKTLTLIDLKTGAYPVYPEKNKQLGFYYLIFVENYKEYKKYQAKIAIHQNGIYKEAEVDKEWVLEIKKLVQDTLNQKEYNFVSGDHCHSCFRRTTCPIYFKNQLPKMEDLWKLLN